MEIISLLLIGIGLSMDSFSLALCYGVLDLGSKKKKLLSIVVGIFHFFMPLFGMVLGNVVEHFIIFDIRYIVYTIFMVLGVEMFFSALKRETNYMLLNMIGLLLFSFTVSVDSFSAGIGIKFISSNYLLCSIIFSLTSAVFTYVGLIIGGIIGSKYKESSKLIGGLILILFALNCLYNG